MTKERINISLDSEIAKQMRHAALEKYGDSKSFSTLIEYLFKRMKDNIADTDIEVSKPDDADLDQEAKYEEAKLEIEDMVQRMVTNYIPYNMPPSTVQKIILAFDYLDLHGEEMCCDDPVLEWTLGCVRCGEKIGTLPELPWDPERAIVRIEAELEEIDNVFNYERVAEECKEMGNPLPKFPVWKKGNHVEEYRQELLREITEANEQIGNIDETLGKMCIYENQEAEEVRKLIRSSKEESQVDSKSKKKAKGKRKST